MSFFLLCSWSSILLFVVMVKRKYRWSAPPYLVLVMFLLAGANATLPAGIFNSMITEYTGLHFFSPDVDRRVLAFFLGAGLGEEFFKLTSGLLVIVVLECFRRDPGPAGRLLGFTIVGLGFATLENLWVYYWVDFWPMMTRGVLAVPLHATMGMIHGLAANASYRHGTPWALFAALLVTTTLHGLYDTADVFLLGLDPRLALGPLIVALLLYGFYHWQRTPEVSEAAAEREVAR